jgi:hypothetical protein
MHWQLARGSERFPWGLTPLVRTVLAISEPGVERIRGRGHQTGLEMSERPLPTSSAASGTMQA